MTRLSIGALVALTLTTATLTAESRLFVFTNATLLEVDLALDNLGAVRSAGGLAGAGESPQSSAGGQFVVSASRFRRDVDGSEFYVVRLWNVHTGGGPARGAFDADTFVFIADPLRPRVLLQDETRLGVLDANSLVLRHVTLPFPLARAKGLLAYAARADQALVRRIDGGLAIVDVATGHTRELPIRTERFDSTVIDPYGRVAFIRSNPRGRIFVTSYELRTGTVKAVVQVPITSGYLQLDAARDRLLLLVWPNGEEVLQLVTLRASTLELVRHTPIANTAFAQEIYTNAAGPDLTLEWRQEVGCRHVKLRLFDAASGAAMTTLDAATAWARVLHPQGVCSFTAAYLTPPPPPMALAASVVGRSVTLSWEDAGDAIDFEIEAGSRPNQGDLVRFRTGGRTFFDWPTVPSGTYYVRVYGWNHLGRSSPSGEYVIRVP